MEIVVWFCFSQLGPTQKERGGREKGDTERVVYFIFWDTWQCFWMSMAVVSVFSFFFLIYVLFYFSLF